MSNLGGYQTITTIFKALGGPRKAAALILGGTLAVGGAVGSLLPGVVRRAKAAVKKNRSSNPLSNLIFTVHTEGDAGSGLTLHVDDQFRVLERDKDAVLIEVLRDVNNPFFVSDEVLTMLSDFPTGALADDQ